MAATVWIAASASPAAAAERVQRGNFNGNKGSTSGLMGPDPVWSAGLQLGNLGGTGVVAQRVGIDDNAVNAGLGFADKGLAVHADYLFFLGDGFKFVPATKYNAMRGRVMPYVGGGAQLGKGVSLRVPVGFQYGMLKDPFNFYGSLALMAGSFLSDDGFGVSLGVAVGARVLL